MNYGMYVAASGAQVQLARQEVLANNLANASTAGFKADELMIRHREAARQEDDLLALDSNAMLERLGAGVMPLPTRIRFAQGPLRETGNALDVALQGEGFLHVARGDDRVALTRDGRLTIGGDGTLVRAADGAPMLDAAGRPIRLDPSLPTRIIDDGTVTQGGAPVARLAVVTVASLETLDKGGGGDVLLPAGATAAQLRPSPARVVPGAIEESSVNAMGTMLKVTAAARAVDGNLKVISTIDEVMGSAISRLGRVTG